LPTFRVGERNTTKKLLGGAKVEDRAAGELTVRGRGGTVAALGENVPCPVRNGVYVDDDGRKANGLYYSLVFDDDWRTRVHVNDAHATTITVVLSEHAPEQCSGRSE